MERIRVIPTLKTAALPWLQHEDVVILGGTHGIGAAVATKALDLDAHSVTVIGRTLNPELDASIAQHQMTFTGEASQCAFLQSLPKSMVLITLGSYVQAPFDTLTPDHMIREYEETVIRPIQAVQALVPETKVATVVTTRPTLEKYRTWGLYTGLKNSLYPLLADAQETYGVPIYTVAPSRVDTKFRDALFPKEETNTRLRPEDVALLVLATWNMKNPNKTPYWIKKYVW
jgi:NAD(P)-dependent dehydrogenase (short-subunit alcohol dehydrogenase family)